jgi:hypothetical protein
MVSRMCVTLMINIVHRHLLMNRKTNFICAGSQHFPFSPFCDSISGTAGIFIFGEYHPLPQVRPSYYYYYYYYHTSLKEVCQSFQIQPNAWMTNNWIVWWHGAHNLAIPMWSVLVLWFVQRSLCWYKMGIVELEGHLSIYGQFIYCCGFWTLDFS